MIVILHNDLTFATLAAALDLWGWQVTRVRSCTFPSRPEPREATWSDALGRPQMQYWYEPDLEVRALESLAYDPEGRSLEVWLTELMGGPCTHAPEALALALLGTSHPEVQHAAAALRLIAARDPRRERADFAGAALLDALCAPEVGPRRAASAQLARVVIAGAREPLGERAERDPDLEVRLHARRALEHLETQSLLRR